MSKQIQLSNFNVCHGHYPRQYELLETSAIWNKTAAISFPQVTSDNLESVTP